MRAVAKYCDEYACLCVREDISGTTCTIFTKFLMHVAYVCGSVLLLHVDDRPHHLSARRGDRSAQRGEMVIYDCLVNVVPVKTLDFGRKLHAALRVNKSATE